MKALILTLALCSAAAFADEPREVQVGAYINDVQHLDLKTHSYNVDLYLWFRWREKGLDPAASLEFVNPFEQWGHTKAKDRETPERLPDGSYYQVMRTQGRFSRKLALYDYPFDRQKLVIEFEDQRLESLSMRYVVAPEGISVNPELELPGFRVGKASFTVVPRIYPTSFGDPRSGTVASFSRGHIELPVERPIMTYALKLLVPVACVILCAALVFFFNPAFVDARVGIGITALLTIVALQITLNEDLPEVDYLVLMDKIYLLSYVFVLATIGLVVRSTRLFQAGDLAAAERLDRRSLVVLSVTYVVALTLVVLPRLV